MFPDKTNIALQNFGLLQITTARVGRCDKTKLPRFDSPAEFLKGDELCIALF